MNWSSRQPESSVQAHATHLSFFFSPSPLSHSNTSVAVRRRTQVAELLAHLSISVENLTSHEHKAELHKRRLAAALLAFRLGLRMRALSASM